jgi:hypothetical protein
MVQIGAFAVLLAGSLLCACSGPTPPPTDAGFFGTDTGGTYGGGGLYGTGGTSGTGGSFAGGNPDQEREDGGREEERRRDGGGGPLGGRRRDAGPTPDASPIAECRTGTLSGAPCMMADATCLVPAGDGGRGEVCSCRIRGGEGTWRCNTP